MAKPTGIIGSGIVAKTLAKGLVKYGYPVMLGTRHPAKMTDWQNGEGKGVKLGSFADAGAFGEILVLAVTGQHAQNALQLAGIDNLNDKTIIDATNPIAEAGPENGVLRFFTDMNESLMEQLQKAFPDAHFVKAFNSVGNAHMVDPAFDSKPTMFICGNDAGAKKEVEEILDKFGWESADMGKMEAARAIEPLCMLWCIPGFLSNEWSHAFKLLKL